MINYENFPEFEKFWEKYPKKVWKRAAFICFKNKNKNEHIAIFDWLDLYLDKWKKEEKPLQFIPDPRTWLSQERYYDEIIPYVDELNQKKLDAFKREEENKKQESEEKERIEKERIKRNTFYNNLSFEEKKEFLEKVDDFIKEKHPSIWAKWGAFLETYRKAIKNKMLWDMMRESWEFTS